MQREFLLREGCYDMQGYLYGRPMPAAELRWNVGALTD